MIRAPTQMHTQGLPRYDSQAMTTPWPTMAKLFWTRQWLTALAFACAAACVCVLLGMWQWDRRETRLARNAVIEAHYDATPVPLAQALATGSGFTTTTQWTPVALTGKWHTEDSLLVRNRSLERSPGYYQLMPFHDDATGHTLVVNRGWLPVGSQSSTPDTIPQPTTSTTTVVVRLRPAEPWDEANLPDGEVLRITPDRLYDSDAILTDGFGVLSAESLATEPDAAPAGMLALPRPVTGEGSHLSYSVQWYIFAAGAFIILGFAARRSNTWATAQITNPNDPQATTTPKRRKRLTDAEIEDAIVDQM